MTSKLSALSKQRMKAARYRTPVLRSSVCRKLLSLLGRGPRYHLILMDSNGKDLAAIGRLVEEGKLKPIIDKVLPLEQVRWAGDCKGPGGWEKADAGDYLPVPGGLGKHTVRLLWRCEYGRCRRRTSAFTACH